MKKNSGKSKSIENPNGVRRSSITGQQLAPRSLRPKRYLLSECTDEELEKAEVKR